MHATKKYVHLYQPFFNYNYIKIKNHISVHSRDNQEVGVAHKVKSPENQPQFSQMMMGQYWLGKTKLKQAFRLTQNAFKKLPWNFNIFYLFNGIFY